MISPTRWTVNFETYRPLDTLPRLLCIASERQGAAYHCAGRYRRHETHCVFEYSLRGEGRFRDANGEHRVPAGSGFLCRVSDPDTAYYFPVEATEPWEFVFICFDGPVATAMVAEFTARYGPVYALPRTGPLVERLLAWESYAGTQPRLSAAAGGALVMELLTALAAANEPPQADDPGNELVIRAQALVRERLQQPLTASQLAALLGVSREHLTRVFRRQLGQTPYHYIQREKILLACRLLKETSLPIQAISRRTGCASQVLFTHRFKRLLHMTPTTFRTVGTIPIR